MITLMKNIFAPALRVGTDAKIFLLHFQEKPCCQDYPSQRTSPVRPKRYWSTSRRRKHAWRCWRKTISANCTSSVTADTAWSAISIWAWCAAYCPACRARSSTSVWNVRHFYTSSMSWSNAAIRTKPSASNICCLKGSRFWCRSSKTRSTPKGRAFPHKSRWQGVFSSTFRRKNISAYPSVSRTIRNETTCASVSTSSCRKRHATATSSAPTPKTLPTNSSNPTSTT